ncbi:helix-turn-helix transcriptional regulator [Kordiimonas aquimaris]|uniref:helix-turn-helix transcriptional regulator n=1 Tax=Kordiimonas aquimaris TaxID=707591 RepID=UPI0021CFF788|nr:YafY family protein [Kordiimonas aquimaris]
MRRADRLFEIIEIMREKPSAVTALSLSRELGVSERTIYRDIAGLQGQGVPIEGEAGIGYVLRPGFHLPPLMFTMDEIETIVLGARLAAQRGGDSIEKTADRVLAKIKSAVPDNLQSRMENVALYAPPMFGIGHGIIDMAVVNDCIRNQSKVEIEYGDANGVISKRIVWPVAIAFFAGSTLLSAWCELRAAFRHFRTDRITHFHVTTDKYDGGNGRLLAAWKEEVTGTKKVNKN